MATEWALVWGEESHEDTREEIREGNSARVVESVPPPHDDDLVPLLLQEIAELRREHTRRSTVQLVVSLVLLAAVMDRLRRVDAPRRE